jgi:hypothetical protein
MCYLGSESPPAYHVLQGENFALIWMGGGRMLCFGLVECAVPKDLRCPSIYFNHRGGPIGTYLWIRLRGRMILLVVFIGRHGRSSRMTWFGPFRPSLWWIVRASTTLMKHFLHCCWRSTSPYPWAIIVPLVWCTTLRRFSLRLWSIVSPHIFHAWYRKTRALA